LRDNERRRRWCLRQSQAANNRVGSSTLTGASGAIAVKIHARIRRVDEGNSRDFTSPKRSRAIRGIINQRQRAGFASSIPVGVLVGPAASESSSIACGKVWANVGSVRARGEHCCRRGGAVCGNQCLDRRVQNTHWNRQVFKNLEQCMPHRHRDRFSPRLNLFFGRPIVRETLFDLADAVVARQIGLDDDDIRRVEHDDLLELERLP